MSTASVAARWELELTRNLRGEYRQRTAHPADVSDPIISREGAVDSKAKFRNGVDLTSQTQ